MIGEDNPRGSGNGVEARILQQLEQAGSCTLNQLVQALPGCTWNQVFVAVDRLSRAGSLTILRHPTTLEYVLQAGAQRPS